LLGIESGFGKGKGTGDGIGCSAIIVFEMELSVPTLPLGNFFARFFLIPNNFFISQTDEALSLKPQLIQEQ